MNNNIDQLLKRLMNSRIKENEKYVDLSIKEPGKIRGEAFQYYVVSSILNIKPGKMGDSRSDGNGREFTIDFIFNNSDCSNIDIFSIQTKNYETDELSSLKDGLLSIFGGNKKLENKILDKKKDLFLKNKKKVRFVNIYCCTLSYSEDVKKNIEDLENDIVSGLKRDYPNTRFNILYITPVDFLNFEKKLISKNIGNYIISAEGEGNFIKYNYNNGDVDDVYIILLSISDLIRIYKKNKDVLFYLNIRDDLGRVRVNKNIEKEINGKYKEYFWCLNNGLTIVCDSFDSERNSKKFNIKNPIIINGQQTLRTISKSNKNVLKNSFILCKIIATSEINFIEKITETTNSQTAIKNQDLKSNHPYLLALEEVLKDYGLFLKRKKGIKNKEGFLSFNSKKVAQIIKSAILFNPYIGRIGKDEILFYNDFEEIFSQKYKEIIIVLFIYDKLNECINNMSVKNKNDTSQFIWHILCQMWKKETIDLSKKIVKWKAKKNRSEIDKEIQKYIDKKIETYKNFVFKETDIVKIYKSMLGRIPNDVIENKKINTYLNTEKSLNLIK